MWRLLSIFVCIFEKILLAIAWEQGFDIRMIVENFHCLSHLGLNVRWFHGGIRLNYWWDENENRDGAIFLNYRIQPLHSWGGMDNLLAMISAYVRTLPFWRMLQSRLHNNLMVTIWFFSGLSNFFLGACWTKVWFP